jgi:hypothetical protein
VIKGLPGGAEGKMHETPAKFKFRSKSTSITDLRKHAKHLVDYLQKVQIQTFDRDKRNELITNSLRAR